MRQYKSCIQIIIIIIILKKNYESQMGCTIKRAWRERGEKRDFIYLFLFSLLLFQIYEN